MTPSLDEITFAFRQLGEAEQLGLIAHLADFLPDDCDSLFPGLEDAASDLGRAIAEENGMGEDDAADWANDFASNLLCAESDLSAKSRAKASRAARIQHGLDWIERRRAMLNPKVAA